MIISTFNRKINIYPEFIISFLDWNNTWDYISWDFFYIENNVFQNIDIEIHTIIHKNWNTYISSIVFRDNLDEYFNNLYLKDIKVLINNNLQIVFKENPWDTKDIIINDFLNINFPWKIIIKYLNNNFIQSISIENYKNIILESNIKEVKFKDYDYQKIYSEWFLQTREVNF